MTQEEINEIACAALGIQEKLRVAGEMVKEQPTVARTEVMLAKELCLRISARLTVLAQDS